MRQNSLWRRSDAPDCAPISAAILNNRGQGRASGLCPGAANRRVRPSNGGSRTRQNGVYWCSMLHPKRSCGQDGAHDTTFFDVHCHAINLGHPNILALLARRDHERGGLGELLFGPYTAFLLRRPGYKFRNLLSVMENDTGAIFRLMEDDLRGEFGRGADQPLVRNGILRIADRSYHRAVLTPLIIDFGVKEMEPLRTYYNRAPSKPIADQVIEMVEGLKRYYGERPDGFFEIYPFLGINPANYDLQTLGQILDTYFARYLPVRRLFRRVHRKTGQLAVKLSTITSFTFLGIKLYPPLGFDPWPAEGAARQKVEHLYRFCQLKRIPITTHCSDAGFTAVARARSREMTSPLRWRSVLHRYPELRINFAHFGRQYHRRWGLLTDHSWRRALVELMRVYPDVYSDIAFNATRVRFYRRLSAFLAALSGPLRERVASRLLFGSDFPLSLIDAQSYAEYVGQLGKAPLDPWIRHALCCRNPARFLFGE
ncbi:MAG: amidohydrolase [Spirochaetaceae bacterium]|nr:MAG: amidohydrolase [Spirochaetaceae bacterium]